LYRALGKADRAEADEDKAQDLWKPL
jgi:hypothetical protein